MEQRQTVEELTRGRINAGNEMPTFYMADVEVEVPVDPKNPHVGSRVEWQRKEKCRILIPGSGEVVDDLVIPGYQDKRFPEAYARFKAGEEAQQTGHPLTQCPVMNRALAEACNREGIFTVEQFLSASHTNLSRLHGALMLKGRVEEWWNTYRDSAKAAEVTAELAAERQARRALEARLAALEAQFGDEPAAEHVPDLAPRLAAEDAARGTDDETTPLEKPRRGRRKKE